MIEALGSLLGASGAATPGVSSAIGGTSGTGGNSVNYSKPGIDLGNPWHVAALAGLVIVAALAWKR